MTDEVTPADALAAAERVGVGTATATATRIDDGTNAVFRVDTGRSDDHGDSYVVKFATFSRASSLRAGLVASRLLATHTGLPVAPVVGAALSPADTPAFVVWERLAGETLPGAPHDTVDAPPPLPAVRALGRVIRAFAAVPDAATRGYGDLRPATDGDWDDRDGVSGLDAAGEGVSDDTAASVTGDADDLPASVTAVGETDRWDDWLRGYVRERYADPPDHDALAPVAERVPAWLDDTLADVPPHPSRSVVLTDLSPSNLLAPDGVAPGPDESLTGVVDLELARLGPAAFTAVNAAYLLTRGTDDPTAVRAALYEPLPFGPDVPGRRQYLVAALGRSVSALSFWYEPGSRRWRDRGDALAAQLRTLLDGS